MIYTLDEIAPLIKQWTINVRLPEVRDAMVRRYYYRKLTEATPATRQAELDKCKADPVHWFNQWVWTYDPRGMAFGLPANLPFVLRPKQIELVYWLAERESTQTHGYIDKSRDEGMSYVILGFFLHHWLFIDGFAAGVGSRKEDLVDKKGDPKTLLHKFRDMFSKLPDWMKPVGFSRREHDNHLRIVNPVNDATITGEAGDNIGRGGRTSMYLLDEWAFVPDQESTDAAISQNTNVHNWLFNSLALKINEIIDQLDQLENRIKPGMTMMWPTSTVPAGYLECAGQAVSRTTYAALFAIIGTSFGSGDGSTTFNIPDMRGEFARGWDHGRGIDTGRVLGSWQDEAFKSHSHTASTASSGSHNHSTKIGGDNNSVRGATSTNAITMSEAAADTAPIGTGQIVDAGNHIHTVTVDSTGGLETRPRNVAWMFIIKF